MPPREPSMEDILASIKKVIAEEKELRSASQVVTADPVADEEEDEAPQVEVRPATPDVLELDEFAVEELSLPPVDFGPPLVSDDAAEASRRRLESLQEVAATAPPVSTVNPLEAMVRDMLRPILKDWLDHNLPAIVDEHVKREIGRITGQPL